MRRKIVELANIAVPCLLLITQAMHRAWPVGLLYGAGC